MLKLAEHQLKEARNQVDEERRRLHAEEERQQTNRFFTAFQPADSSCKSVLYTVAEVVPISQYSHLRKTLRTATRQRQ